MKFSLFFASTTSSAGASSAAQPDGSTHSVVSVPEKPRRSVRCFRLPAMPVLLALGVLLLVAMLLAISFGSTSIPLFQIIQ
ncbi:MAG: hypothetical protein J2P37_13185, partial [Ktedonobacteraceae bacterium]|nr:hypothetical protein [Ktedonobacteraceae bacterium]